MLKLLMASAFALLSTIAYAQSLPTPNVAGLKVNGTAQNFPASGNLVGTTDSQTLTNKSIAGSEVNSGTVGIGFGGTGQSTANAALNALLPSQSGKTGGYVLGTDGTNAAWQLRDPINVQVDYGAKCDNSTDNSTALQNAVNASASSGRALYIPSCSSTYNYSTTLTITTPSVVFGDGPQASRLKYTGTSDATSISGTVQPVWSSFGIQAASPQTTGTSLVNSTIGGQFDHMYFFNGYNCLSFTSSGWSSHVTFSEFNTCGNSTAAGGVAILYGSDKSANNAVILGNHIHDGWWGISAPNGFATAINYNDIEGEHQGLHLGGGTEGLVSVDLDDNYIEGSGTAGNIFFSGTPSYDSGTNTGVVGVSMENDFLGASTANNWVVKGLVIKNLSTYNYAPFIDPTSSATVENVFSSGTGSLGWAAGSTTVILPQSTVANLPSASTYKGSSAVVTDATACTSGAAPTGGGSTICPVYSNGTSWIH
jgi:hypothetical protein